MEPEDKSQSITSSASFASDLYDFIYFLCFDYYPLQYNRNDIFDCMVFFGVRTIV